MDSIELEKVDAMMRELHERLCALVPEYWPMGASEPDPAERWAGFSDDEVDELHYGLVEAESEDPRPGSNSRRMRMIDELASEAERRAKSAATDAQLAGVLYGAMTGGLEGTVEISETKPDPSQKDAMTNYRRVSNVEAGGFWSSRDSIVNQCATDQSEWFSYNHTRREFARGVWGQDEKTDAPERWSGWSDEELDRLGQMLGDGGHELADLRAEVRRRHEADGLSDAERRAVEVLARGEWPDHPERRGGE